MRTRVWFITLYGIAIVGFMFLGACGGGGDEDEAVDNPIVSSSCDLNPISSSEFNVKNYGARGDGVHDDTAAIQSAVEAAAGSDGTVVVPAGVYMVNAVTSITLRSHMTLELASGAFLKANSASYQAANYAILLAAGVDYVNVVGGTLEGDAFSGGHTGTTGQWGHGLAIIKNPNSGKASTHIVVKGVKSQYCWGDGFYVSGGAEDVLFCNVEAAHNRRSGTSVTEANRVTIIDSTFQRSTGFMDGSDFKCGSGINIEPNAGESVSSMSIRNCVVSANAGSGVSVGKKEAGTTLTGIVIEDNTIAGNGTYASSASRGIWLTDGASGLQVRGNTVQDNRGIGIHLVGGADHSSVTGNTVTGTIAKSDPQLYGGGEGILLERTHGNTVTGNTVRDNDGCGIRDAYPTGGNTVSGNTSSGNGACP